MKRLNFNITVDIVTPEGESEIPVEEEEAILDILQFAIQHQYGSAGITSDEYAGFCETIKVSKAR